MLTQARDQVTGMEPHQVQYTQGGEEGGGRGGANDTTRDGEMWKVAEEEEVGAQRVYWLSA